MIRYVDAYRDQFGVELICRVLGNTAGGFITSRGYRAAKSRPMSDRAVRDQVLGDEMERLHAENYGGCVVVLRPDTGGNSGYSREWHLHRKLCRG